jgi:predicted glycoside hydrolase/deacetylase ChbG (UPF0249 family)
MNPRLFLSWLLVLTTASAFGQQPQSPAASVSAASVQERLGYSASSRLLIIHADDLGMSHAVNRATLEALEKGWVTSAAILVPCPWFPAVVSWAKQHPDADLGIHLALNSEWTTYRWGPVSATSQVRTLLDEQGYLPLLETAVVQRASLAEAEVELRAQIERARDAGIPLSHLDTHMTTLTQSPGLFDLYHRLGRAYQLPVLLERTPGPYNSPHALIDRVMSIDVGVEPTKKEWLKAYKKMLEPLPAGVYQLIVHTAYEDPEMQAATFDHPNWGAKWRQLDLEVVSSDDFRKFLKDQGFILVRWKDLKRVEAAPATAAAR